MVIFFNIHPNLFIFFLILLNLKEIKFFLLFIFFLNFIVIKFPILIFFIFYGHLMNLKLFISLIN